jgi:hypothetical protein
MQQNQRTPALITVVYRNSDAAPATRDDAIIMNSVVSSGSTISSSSISSTDCDHCGDTPLHVHRAQVLVRDSIQQNDFVASR